MLHNLALSESGFLFDTRTGATYSVSKTGTFLLKELIAGATPTSLPERLIETYEVDHLTASRDVERFLFRLRDLGILSAELPRATRGGHR